MKKEVLFLLVACCLYAAAQDTKLKPGAIKSETVSFTKARNYAFCEIYGFGAIAPSN